MTGLSVVPPKCNHEHSADAEVCESSARKAILLDTCTPQDAHRYLTAPNAEVQRRQDGSNQVDLPPISLADDRGHPGKYHGRSARTTERVRNEFGPADWQ
jgi:hypothetical protein